jgi:ribosomal protein S18 acetylase RimI-like enzyme
MILIKTASTLTETEISDFRRLESVVKIHDGLQGDLSLEFGMNVIQSMDNIFMLYENNVLLSALTIFLPSMKAAEINGFTHPEHRKQGYFRSLLIEAIRVLSNYLPIDLLFVCESGSESGLKAVERFGGVLAFSEYSLQFDASTQTVPALGQQKLSIRKAEPSDLNALIEISKKAFHDRADDAERFILQSMASKHKIQYAAILDDIIIGMGACSIEDSTTYIVGLSIDPDYQGKGYGKILVNLLMNELIQSGKNHLSIEVDSSNASAYHIYLNAGFKLNVAFGYYLKHLT